MLSRNNVCGILYAGNILCRCRDCAHFRGNSRNGSAISGWYRRGQLPWRASSAKRKAIFRRNDVCQVRRCSRLLTDKYRILIRRNHDIQRPSDSEYRKKDINKQSIDETRENIFKQLQIFINKDRTISLFCFLKKFFNQIETESQFFLRT